MDLFLYAGIVIVCLIIAVIGYYRSSALVGLAGAVIVGLAALALSVSPLTEHVLIQQNTSYVYGNQTINYFIVGETENMTSFPYLFTATYTPLVGGSESCYYTSNSTLLDSQIVSTSLGTINITG